MEGMNFRVVAAAAPSSRHSMFVTIGLREPEIVWTVRNEERITIQIGISVIAMPDEEAGAILNVRSATGYED
jgi:hypothetical protein